MKLYVVFRYQIRRSGTHMKNCYVYRSEGHARAVLRGQTADLFEHPIVQDCATMVSIELGSVTVIDGNTPFEDTMEAIKLACIGIYANHCN